MGEMGGTIITFYSYKGGTGRSMALANLAWILASNGKRVLAIDWDLEAPGLHRYFRPFLIDSELLATDGLADFFWQYAEAAMTPLAGTKKEDATWEEGTDLTRFRVQVDWEFKGGGELDLIPAGRQCTEYAERVNSFDWTNFYRRLDGELLIKQLKGRLKREYDYVLIDSRTGVSDSAGICTVAMPDRVVAFFTLNRQSVEGVAAVLESVSSQRKEIKVFPVVTRIELAEKDRLEASRRRARQVFARFLPGATEDQQRKYWTDAEILYHPYYAYEEVLACFGDATGADYSQSSLLASMERLGKRVTGEPSFAMPAVAAEERKEVLDKIAGASVEANKLVADFDSRSDARRDRADHFLKKELHDQVQRYRRRARSVELIYQSAAIVIVCLSCGLIALLQMTWGRNGKLISALGPSMAALALALIAKVSELGLRRSSGTSKLFLSFGAMVALCGLAAPTLAFTTTGELWFPLEYAFLIPVLQLALMVTGFDTRALRLNAAAAAIERESRAYVGVVDPYVENNGEQVAWRRFRHAVEEIVSNEPLPEPLISAE